MEIYVFNEKLELLSSIDDFEKVVWIENFFEADTVSIEIDFNLISDVNNFEYDKNKALFESITSIYVCAPVGYKNGVYEPRFIAIDYFGKESIRIANIESYSINENDKKLEIKARGFLSLFEYKYAYDSEYIPTPNQDDFVGMVASRVLNDHIENDPVLNKIFIANELDNKVGSEVYFATESGNNVYESITKLLTTFDLGFSTIYDTSKNKIMFNVIDSSKRKIEVAISRDDENLKSNDYEFDLANFRNYITMQSEYTENNTSQGASEGTGTDTENDKVIIETIDNSKGGIILSMITDSNKKQLSMTETEFREMLKTEALEELTENTIEEHFDIGIDDNVDVNLGDKAVVKLFLGYKEIAKEILITSIEHEFTKKEYTRKVGFGKPYDAKKELQKILGV